MEDVEVVFMKTGSSESITEVECHYCGAKENCMAIVNSGEGGIKTAFNRLQASAKYVKKFNGLWKKIETKKFNKWEAIYNLKRLTLQHSKDEMRGFIGGDYYGKLEARCVKCSQPIAFDVTLKMTVKSIIPETITVDIWRTLKDPPREIIARLSRGVSEAGGLGGTAAEILERVNPEKFICFEKFIEETEVKLSELSDVPPDMKSDFESFLKSFREWIDKERNAEFSRYINALYDLADYSIVHGTVPVAAEAEESEKVFQVESVEEAVRLAKGLGKRITYEVKEK